MATKKKVVHSDPEIMHGQVVFVGTRVPAEILFQYLEAGDSLDEFLAQFPTVKRSQAIAALKFSREALLASARSPG
jgi:uncharacterized protein (DUF433 family)